MVNYYADNTRQHLRVWLKLLKTSSNVEAVLRERLRRECGTTLPRFDVMAALDHHPDGLRMSDLSSFLKVSNGNTTGIVNRLVREVGPMATTATAFPSAAGPVSLLRAAAEANGSHDFTPLWSGQNATGCRELPAADLLQILAPVL